MKVTPTVFCDEEGYDLVPFQMISVINDPLIHQESDDKPQGTLKDEANLLYLREDISVKERESSEEISDYSYGENHLLEEEYYDASDELEEYQEEEPILIQLRDGREIPMPNQCPKLMRRERRGKQTRSRGQRTMPEFKNKSHYLIGV